MDNVDNLWKVLKDHVVKNQKKPENTEKIRNLEKDGKICENKRNPHLKVDVFNNQMWITWISYLERRFSPIFTTFPAPIVINKSPFIHFFCKKDSISSKLGK